MEKAALSLRNFRGLPIFAVVISVGWTIAVGGSLDWNILQHMEHTREAAIIDARANVTKDQAFRYWATAHGGVYVPTDERTPPNPYLAHVPERDLTTPSGRKLTLMNPAYILRQTMEEFSRFYGVRGHITSAKPLRPMNAPDEWEKTSLLAFERGVEETIEFSEIEGEPYLRLMHPMITEKGCLKCHAHQGYQEGDVRGGVSISVPMKSYLGVHTETNERLFVSHGIVWLLGLGLIGVGSTRMNHQLQRRKKAEEDLRQANDDLEMRVEERTAALSQANMELETQIAERKRIEEALIEAKAEAEAANQAKSRFLASISHDLRTPLNAIIGFSEMMKQGIFGPLGGPRYEEYTSDIHDSGHFLLNLIDDILDLSKIEAGKFELVERIMDLGLHIHGSVKLIAPQAEAKGVRLSTDVPADLPALLGDERAVTQVLNNLLSNSAKFTGEKGTISVSASINKEGGVEVRVEDDGIGMSRDEIAQAMKPFVQMDSSVSRRHEGTGLGLSICERFVEMHSGTLVIESEVGKGTTVAVRFPPERIFRPS
jgi:signal transduction histidine kinase